MNEGLVRTIMECGQPKADRNAPCEEELDRVLATLWGRTPSQERRHHRNLRLMHVVQLRCGKGTGA